MPAAGRLNILRPSHSRPTHVQLMYPPVPCLKIDHWSIFKKEWTLYGVWRSFHILKVDPWLILLKGNEGFGGFEADRLRDRILCTQRTWRG